MKSVDVYPDQFQLSPPYFSSLAKFPNAIFKLCGAVTLTFNLELKARLIHSIPPRKMRYSFDMVLPISRFCLLCKLTKLAVLSAAPTPASPAAPGAPIAATTRVFTSNTFDDSISAAEAHPEKGAPSAKPSSESNAKQTSFAVVDWAGGL